MSTLFRTREAVWYRIKIYSRYRITNNHISIFKIMKIKPSWRSWQICPKLTKKIHQNNSIKCHSWNFFVNFIDKSSCDLAFHKKSLASYFTKKDVFKTSYLFSLYFHNYSQNTCYTKQFRVSGSNFCSNKPINDQCTPWYRSQSIDLHYKSIDCFLYDGEHWLLMS